MEFENLNYVCSGDSISLRLQRTKNPLDSLLLIKTLDDYNLLEFVLSFV